MPVTEGPVIDGRMVLLRGLLDWVKDDPRLNPYLAAEAERQQEAQAKAERSARMSAIAKLRRRNVAKRPWQAAGFLTKQAWLEATQKE